MYIYHYVIINVLVNNCLHNLTNIQKQIMGNGIKKKKRTNML